MIPSHLVSSFPFCLPPPSLPPSPNPTTNFSSSPPPPLRPRRARCPCRRRGGSAWDSNAEPVRPGRRRFDFQNADDGEGEEGDENEDGGFQKSGSGRRWWSDESANEFDEDFDMFDDDSEQPWEKIWIFKVFKSYGYLLPAIIASMLLATGPKAFLMALALPLGQSAISLAIDKVWGRKKDVPRTRRKTKRKPFARPFTSGFRKQEDEESSDDEVRNGFQTWMSSDAGAADQANGSRRSSFGGWDDLDDQEGSTRRKAPSVDGSSRGRGEPQMKGKLSRKGRYRDVPLFLRLLIAVFPFLGSWTRMF